MSHVPPQPMLPRRSALLALLALAVVGAMLGTTTAQHATGLAHRGLLEEAARLVLSGVITLLVVTAGVLVATLVGRDLFRRRTLFAPSSDGIPRWQRALIAIAALVIIGGFGYLVVLLGHHVTPNRPPPPATGTGQRQFLAKARATPTHFALLVPVAIGVGILVLLGLWVLLARRRRREERRILLAQPPAPDALAPVDLAPLRSLGDPRAQVQLAWQAAETVLARSGFPRNPAESASEYVHRLHRSDDAPPELDTLLDLFLNAKYSEHPLTQHDGVLAIDLAELILARQERAGVGA